MQAMEPEDDEIIIEIPHPVDTEISLLVTKNHRLLLKAIKASENEYIEHLRADLASDDDALQSCISQAGVFYDDLRRSANHAALVSLTTRLDRWVRVLAGKVKARARKNKSRPRVVCLMEDLNEKLGNPPETLKFFEELITARDSVIHGDSRAMWGDRQTRKVSKGYVNAYGDLEFNEDHLREAVDRVTRQLKWYDEQAADKRQG